MYMYKSQQTKKLTEPTLNCLQTVRAPPVGLHAHVCTCTVALADRCTRSPAPSAEGPTSPLQAGLGSGGAPCGTLFPLAPGSLSARPCIVLGPLESTRPLLHLPNVPASPILISPPPPPPPPSHLFTLPDLWMDVILLAVFFFFSWLPKLPPRGCMQDDCWEISFPAASLSLPFVSRQVFAAVEVADVAARSPDRRRHKATRLLAHRQMEAGNRCVKQQSNGA